MPQSKYAEQLQRLGFQPKSIDRRNLEEIKDSLRGTFKIQPGEEDPNKPWQPEFFYLKGEDTTIARDEHGVSWFAKGNVDLRSLGFIDALPHMLSTLEMLKKRTVQN